MFRLFSSKCLVFLATLLFLAASASQAANSLINHPSPYLALHGEDPVNWLDWGPEILQKAQQEKKLIYISSGYFSCHWCHVMQKESYSSSDIAALLNDHFIPVKLDRELNPALDAYLIDFVQRTNGTAGWPLNVFLTPEGYPLAGLTYAPKARFGAILTQVVKLWAGDSEKLAKSARLAATGSALKPSELPAIKLTSQQLRENLFKQAFSGANEMEGGIGDGSRFPMAPQYRVLTELTDAKADSGLNKWIRLTLDNTAKLGMYDHINGGFFRYTVDPDQQTPHFEKMLYNQALQAILYFTAAEQFASASYKYVARDTLDFTLNWLLHPNGGYIASLSAVNSADEEGAGYLWSDEELGQLLTAEEQAFAKKYWSLTGTAPFDFGRLPMLKSLPEPTHVLREQVRSKLGKAARKKAHPRDTKRIASWNGLLLSALAKAVTDKPSDPKKDLQYTRYLAAGEKLRDFMVQQLVKDDQHKKTTRIYRSVTAEGPFGVAALEDYAFVAQGLADWAKITDNRADRKLAARIVNQAWKSFYRKDSWHPAGDSSLPGMMGEEVMSEGPLPSPPAYLIDLAFELGSEESKTLARNALKVGYMVTSTQPFWHPTQLLVLSQHLEGL